VARLHKDWDKGNTSLGAMVTETHRWISDPALAFLPTNALAAGVDFVGFFANRAWTLEARGLVSQVRGAREAITGLQTDPVHYYQRPGATHLGVDPNATSLFGHGGSLLFGRSGEGRLRLTNHFHWYSPGLELNDLGYLKQADVLANQVFLGWEEPTPHGVLRSYSAQLAREDKWDFGGLQTNATTSLDASGMFTNKWSLNGRLAYDQVVDTRALRGGPALRWHDYYTALLGAGSDPSRRVSLSLQGEHSGSSDDDSRSTKLTTELQFRLSSRLSASARLGYETLRDNLQYVTTAESGDGARWLLARIARDTWDFTVRVNLSLTPDLTVQFYGSPYIGTGRYAGFKRATDPLARTYANRFHAFGADEITYRPDVNAYDVSEVSGPAYSFANPDFSFRQFRSNLVVRWEFRPGSSVYVVWSQGRTDGRDQWQQSFSRNWDELWTTRPQNVFLVKLSYWFSP
jgi:hypothetical protein